MSPLLRVTVRSCLRTWSTLTVNFGAASSSTSPLLSMVTVILSPSPAGWSVTVVVYSSWPRVSFSNCSAPETLSSLLTMAGWPPVKMSSLAVTLAVPEVPLAGILTTVPSDRVNSSGPWAPIGRPAALVKVTV
ncbi:hypothetical protein D3C85_1463950 [compost metagenome]